MNALVVAVGPGTENLPVQSGLIRLGRREDVAVLLSACDLLVSSSAYGEGQSNSIAEAMASACPVVATDVGDARAMLEGGPFGPAGLVVPPRDPLALRRAIERLLADECLRNQMGASGRARVETLYRPEDMVRTFAAVLSPASVH